MVPLAAPSARADDAAESVAVTARRVDVHLTGDALAIDGLTRVLRERLSDAGAEVAFQTADAIDAEAILAPPSADRAHLAHVWVDLAGEQGLTVYVVDATSDRILVRRVARQDNPEVAWEGVGHIVELAVAALRAGERIGIERAAARRELLPAAEPSAPPAPPPPPPREREIAVAPPVRKERTLSPGLFYETLLLGDGPEPVTGPGAMLELTVPTRRLTLGGVASAQYRLPLVAAGDGAEVRLEGGAFRVLGSASFAVSKAGTLAVDLGPGLDVTAARAIEGPLVRATSPSTSWSFVARAELRYSHDLRVVRVFATVGLDAAAQLRRYVLDRGSERVVAFEPWPIRPFASVGVALP
ncbi:MAG: hypothetical protein KF819_32455 [Labilithrix sp.]|nr:hypothetical protein [Labilithrix sp.]